jgi:Tol biopolymer transport system component
MAACASRREFAGLGSRWRWTPDSQALAYVDAKTQSDLWVQPLDGSAPRRLSHFEPDGQEIWGFDWSADGRRLAVSRGTTAADIVLFRGLRGKK